MKFINECGCKFEHEVLENAICKADEYKRSPLDIEICPFGYEMCTGDCYQYEEGMEDE